MFVGDLADSLVKPGKGPALKRNRAKGTCGTCAIVFYGLLASALDGVIAHLFEKQQRMSRACPLCPVTHFGQDSIHRNNPYFGRDGVRLLISPNIFYEAS
jgi:hypothetical protein